MRRIVFYSWQSDLPTKCNRSFIEDALKRALKAIRKDSSHTLEPVLDRDTAGQAGSPSISESIFSKISLSDLFIADVSIVNRFERRAHPNPNVLTEIGYAAAELGWDRIILIQNTAFGTPDELPFDLRGRRIITYNISDDEKTRSEERGLLQGRLEGEIRLALDETTISGLPSGPTSAVWWGEWLSGEIDLESGSLFIRDIGTSGFYFELAVFNGAHSGTASGYARLVSPTPPMPR